MNHNLKVYLYTNKIQSVTTWCSYLLLRVAAFLALNTFTTTIVEDRIRYSRYKNAAPKQELDKKIKVKFLRFYKFL